MCRLLSRKFPWNRAYGTFNYLKISHEGRDRRVWPGERIERLRFRRGCFTVMNRFIAPELSRSELKEMYVLYTQNRCYR